MAKPTKKKAVTSPATNNKKPAVKAKKLQQPNGGFIADCDPVARVNHFRAPESALHAGPEVLNRLWTVIESRKAADPGVSHSARLLAKGTARVAQKLGEEAVECVIEAMAGNRVGLIGESADVLYHLLVAWVHAGIRPEEVWDELQQRERVSRLTEGAHVSLKRLLDSAQIGTSKIP